jgi:hypothetical protein
MSSVVIESTEGREALERLAAEHGVEGDRLAELLAAVASHSGMLRRRGLFQRFDAILDRATP